MESLRRPDDNDPTLQLECLYTYDHPRRKRWRQLARWTPTHKGNSFTDIDGIRYVTFRRGSKFGFGVAVNGGGGIVWRAPTFFSLVDARAAVELDYCIRQPKGDDTVSEFEKMRDGLVQELMNVSRFDSSKMSAKAHALVAAAVIEFAIVAVAALDEPARKEAVRGLREGLQDKVTAMVEVLRKVG
jgi:hypothetical protein